MKKYTVPELEVIKLYSLIDVLTDSPGGSSSSSESDGGAETPWDFD